MQNYECELVKKREVNSSVLKSIKFMKMSPPIKVQIRQHGMTSTGKEYCCHPNVEYLVEKIGGHRLLGYMICGSDSDGESGLVPHSVWITPEGNLADVTRRTEIQKITSWSIDPTICFFVPVTTNRNVILPVITIPHNRSLGMFVEKLTDKFDGFNYPPRKIKLAVNAKLKNIYMKVECHASFYGKSPTIYSDPIWFERAK